MAHQYGDNFDHRRKAQKVFVDRATGDVILRLHQTDIVRVTPAGDVTLSTGGWPTHKTINSMNDALELFEMAVAAVGNIPNGRWTVMDSDGTIHPYISTRENYTITIRSKGADQDKQRVRWLAEAYNVAYHPPVPPVAPRTVAVAGSRGPRIAPAAAPRPHVSPTAAHTPAAPAAATVTRANGTLPAASPAARPGGTWATVARASAMPAANTGSGPAGLHSSAHPVRMTGPGAAAAAATGPSRAAGFSGNSSGNGLAQPSTAIAGRPQAPAAHSTPSPAGQAGGPQPPPLPVGAQLVQQMERLGIDQQELENDAHLCVVCMEEPRSIVLVPCGHMALCKDCCELIIVQQQQQCPMCCQDVEYHVEVDQ